MESESSLPHSQVHSNCPSPELVESGQYLPIPLLNINFNRIVFLKTQL
jgi:hypothetical protein